MLDHGGDFGARVAIKAQTKLDGWKEQREAEEAKRDKARSKAEQLQREIEAMCREAGCTSADELPAAEQYARLRLVAAVLHRAIERFRDASQGPVLDRASDWFAALTLGSFSGLRADYDDKGGAVLVGIRAGTIPESCTMKAGVA